jgi:hypothetical protein
VRLVLSTMDQAVYQGMSTRAGGEPTVQ